MHMRTDKMQILSGQDRLHVIRGEGKEREERYAYENRHNTNNY